MVDTWQQSTTSNSHYRIPLRTLLRTALVWAVLSWHSVDAQTVVCDAAQLRQATSTATAGKVIVLCNRTWADTKIAIAAKGTASSPVRLTAQTPGKVILTGASTVQMSGSFIQVDGLVFQGTTPMTNAAVEFRDPTGANCNDCRLSNSAFVSFVPVDSQVYREYVTIFGQRNQVDHNFFSGKTNRGASVAVFRRAGHPPDNSKIEYNYFSRPSLGQNNGESVQIGQGVPAEPSGAVVARNYFFRADGEVEIISVKAMNVTVFGNTIDSSQGTITLRHGSANRVEGNFIMGRGRDLTGGIRVTGPDHVIVNNYIANINPTRVQHLAGIVLHAGESEDPMASYTRVRHALVANNTLVNTGAAPIVIGQGYETMMPEQIILSNNIVSSQANVLVAGADKLLDSTIERNILHGSSTGLLSNALQLLVDPQLVADATGLLRPASTSPARSAGTTLTNVTHDILGRARATPFDIGAFNVDTGRGEIEGPATRCDVGPQSFSPDGVSCEKTASPRAPVLVSVR